MGLVSLCQRIHQKLEIIHKYVDAWMNVEQQRINVVKLYRGNDGGKDWDGMDAMMGCLMKSMEDILVCMRTELMHTSIYIGEMKEIDVDQMVGKYTKKTYPVTRSEGMDWIQDLGDYYSCHYEQYVDVYRKMVNQTTDVAEDVQRMSYVDSPRILDYIQERIRLE